MARYNAWITMSQQFKDELWGYVRRGEEATQFPLINTINDVTGEFFQSIYDAGAVERLFKPWNAAGRTYKLWSFYANKPENVSTIRDDWDMLIAAYPQDFSVSGAWDYETGQEVGGENPWYPIPNQLLNFMPDIWVSGSPPDPPVYEEASVLTDVILIAGQAPRSFASYQGGGSD